MKPSITFAVLSAVIWSVGISIDATMHLATAVADERASSQSMEVAARGTLAHIESVADTIAEVASDDRWHAWSSQLGHDTLAAATTLPIRHTLMFNSRGDQIHVSFDERKDINVSDRPYFMRLQTGEQSTYFGPYTGRNTGRSSYAYARRINGPSGEFDGVVLAVVGTDDLQALCLSAAHRYVGLELRDADGKTIVECNGGAPGVTGDRMVSYPFSIAARADRASYINDWLIRFVAQTIIIVLGFGSLAYAWSKHADKA